jgi:hypothetical protein
VGLSILEDRIASLRACRIRHPPFPRQTPSFAALITLAGTDLAWACCIGKAFRIVEERINRNTRNGAQKTSVNPRRKTELSQTKPDTAIPNPKEIMPK